MAEKKIALFIDADNISAKFGKQIIKALENRGEIFIRRIYGNWEKTSLHGWNDCIRDLALRPVQQTDFVTGKNATDMSLTIDAMDVLHRDNAEIFALVTNDSDFTPLVIRLREGGVNIIGIGNANASNAFRAACSEFIALNTLAEVKPAQSPPVTKKILPAPVKPIVPVKPPVTVKPPVAKKKSAVQLSLFDDFNVEHEPPPVTANPKVISLDERKLQSERDKKIQLMHDALRDSSAVHANAEGFASLNHAGQYVRNKNFDFTVRDFGYNQLKDFIAAYPNLYETRDNGQNFFYRCRTTDKPALVVDNDRLKQMHEVLREAAVVTADSNGFANLGSVGMYLSQQNLGFNVKALGYGTLQKFIAAFPEMYELRQVEDTSFVRYRVSDPNLPENARDRLQVILREAALLTADDSGFADFGDVNAYIAQQNLGFSVKDLGYRTLQKFIAAFPNLYELQDDKIRCRDPKLPEDALDQLHNAMREAVATHADDTGFANLCAVGNFIVKKNIGSYVKGLGYGTLQKFIAAFPNLYELQDDKIRCRDPKLPEDALDQLHNAMREAVATHADDTGFANLCAVGNFIVKKNIGSYVKGLGYGTLQKFIVAFPNLYEMQDEKIRCRDPKLPEDALDQLHNAMREAVATHADDTGFANLCAVGNFIAQKNLGFDAKSLGYSSMQKFLSAFSNLYELHIDDNKALLRCRTNEVADALEQLHEVLHEAAALHEDSDGFVNLWWACDLIIGKKNLVNEIKSMTYKDLVDFLNDFPDRYEIRQEPGKDLCYRCRKIKPKPAENNRLQQLHKILHETAQDNRDKSGFVDLTCAGQNIHDKNFTIKGLGYGSLSKFVSAFPKLYEMRTVGKIVRYRCRQSQK